MNSTNNLAQALRPVVEELERLEVPYYVGGSVASTYHGAGRSTLDVDLAAELDEPTGLKLAATLQNDYYVSLSAIRDAIKHRSCFNLIHHALVVPPHIGELELARVHVHEPMWA